MKRFLKFIGIFAGLVIISVIVIAALTPWMDRWSATDVEIAASFPGDGLVPEPAGVVNRAVTIQATPKEIYPWIVQLDAKRGGWYSYTWLETYLLNCPIVNADRIHEEWQNLKVGDEVHMCPNQPAPPPYVVAQIHPNESIVMGHQENGEWVDSYQFVIIPQSDGSSHLILRTRTMVVGGFWTIIHPGIFIMERGMLLGIKERAERLAESRSVSPVPEVTPTPEVFIPLDEAIPGPDITLEGVEVTVKPLRIVLSSGVASGARGLQFPRAEVEEVVPWELTPGHIQLKLEGYLLQDKFHQPQIYVYPAQAYAEMYPPAFESIRRVDNIVYGSGGPLSAEQLPAVPFFNAGQIFASNI